MRRVTVTWRFFAGEDARWRWQQLTTDRVVIAESRLSYSTYEDCILAARSRGYTYVPAQKKVPWPNSRVHSRP